MQTDTTATHAAAIYAAAWHVRNTRTIHRTRYAQAVQRLGLTVRQVFNESEDFGPLLQAVADSLKTRDSAI